MNTNADLKEFFVVGGTLWSEAPSYITRPADEELFKLALAGEYCDILAARQMGKSSLMVRTANRLQGAGIRTAILDISTLGGGISTPDAWFFGFLDELSFQLGLNEDMDRWWEAHANNSPVQRFSNFLRDVALVEVRGSVVIFVDEIDSALGMPFTDDFFAAIRAAYNARATNPEFKRLTFILLGVARPADLIHDRNRTPYNIGTHIRLSDFTLPELHSFQAVFDEAYPSHATEILEWVLYWTNGQPYLTQKLCAEIIRAAEPACTKESVARTVNRLFFTEDARKQSNLRAIRDRIESSPNKVKMLQIYGGILHGQRVLDDLRSPAKTELKLIGLVRTSGQKKADIAHLEARNRIYQTVFDLAWVRKNLPRSQSRQFAILASFLVVLAFVIAGYAIHRGQIQTSLTFIEQFQTSNSPEVKLTSLARLLELDDHARAQALELYANLSHEEKLDLFAGLSNPQDVSAELVSVIEAVYQENENNSAGYEILNVMKTVLGSVGAPGAPGLKTEIEFWLKGRKEVRNKNHALTAISFFDSAWSESLNRGHPNYSVRFDRAIAFIKLEEYAAAFDDLQAIWEGDPERQAEIKSIIQSNPALSTAIFGNVGAIPEILSLITPIPPTVLPTRLPTSALEPSATFSPSPTVVESPEASMTPEVGKLSPYSGWIVLGMGEASAREIYLMDPLGRALRQVTYNEVVDEDPSFSPDNWAIVYASNRSQDGWELYSYDLRRNTEQQLTSFPGQARFPIWSPVLGDTRILFEGRIFDPVDAINIWMLDVASGQIEQLTQDGADSRPVWSPDGTKILFGRATQDTTGDGKITVNDALDIFSLDLASGVEKNLTNTPDFDDFNFAWSPDAKKIAFTSVRQDVTGDGMVNLNDSQDLYIIRADGSGERRLDLGGKKIYTPSWSPDGRFILVLVAVDAKLTEIWRYDTVTGNFIPLTGSGAYNHPTYSK